MEATGKLDDGDFLYVSSEKVTDQKQEKENADDNFHFPSKDK